MKVIKLQMLAYTDKTITLKINWDLTNTVNKKHLDDFKSVCFKTLFQSKNFSMVVSPLNI